MKTVFSFFFVILCIGSRLFAQSDVVFGVKPGTVINSAYFGLKMDNLVPMVGADVLWITASGEYTSTEDNHWGSFYSGTIFREKRVSDLEFDGSALLVIPHIGAKYLLGSGDVRPYFFANAFFSIPSVKLETDRRDEWWSYEDDKLVDHGKDSGSENLDSKTKETINDILGFWGVTLGGGAEYFFSERFSIGGEYGIRLFFNSVDISNVPAGPDADSYGETYTGEWEGELSASLRLTYAVVSLNFYF